MAGIMNTACRDIRPVLTECLMLGTPLPHSAAEHLNGCQDCLRDAAEIKDVVRTLQRAAAGTAPTGRFDGATVAPPPDLRNQVRRGIAQAGQARTRRRHRVALGTAALMTATAAALVPVLASQQPARPVTSVALAREGQMVVHTWGTEVPVALTGLQPGQAYRVMTADASGHSMPGGSVRVASAQTVHIRIVTAMPRDAITTLLVEDDSGHIVARMAVTSPGSAA